MKISPQRKMALFLAALILMGGALLLLSPGEAPPNGARHDEPSLEPSAASTAISPKERKNPTQPDKIGQPDLGADYGLMLIKMIVAVALVCLLAYAILRWGVGRLAGGRTGGEEMQILGRLPIAPNRTIMVVQIGPRFLVVGNTETEISLLSELSAENAKKYFAPQVSDN